MGLEDLKQLTDYKKNQTRLCTIISYLIGVRWELCRYYVGENEDLFLSLDKDENCRIIRALCCIRTNLMLTYDETDRLIRYDLKNLNNQDLYRYDIKILHDYNIDIIKNNRRSNGYLIDVNNLIVKRINTIRSVFPEWIRWDYIRKLFIMPKGDKMDCVIAESRRYNKYKKWYPYNKYINWFADDYGNPLISDIKFAKILYQQNGDVFSDYTKVKDASEKVVKNIYEFIDESERIDIVVDCENCDVYKIVSLLTQLENEELKKINRMVLYDDVNTTTVWNYLGNVTSIPIEHILVERISSNKSLVDIKMCMGISQAFYKDEVNSFIIVSSDSDFGGVISSLPEARFLVMVEKANCGESMIKMLEKNGTLYCYIDDFCTGNIGEFKSQMLRKALNAELPQLLNVDLRGIVNELIRELRLNASVAEKQNIYENIVKGITLKIDKSGIMTLKI